MTDLALMVLEEERNRARRMQKRTALIPVLPEKMLRQMMLEPHLPARLFHVQDSTVGDVWSPSVGLVA